MPPRLKRLSGKEAISILSQFGFSVRTQRGSHVKLQRMSPSGEKQTLTVVMHEELDKGTLRAMIRQASRYIPEEKLKAEFYSE